MLENLIPLYMYKGGQPLPRPARLYDYVIAGQGIIKRVETVHASVDLLLTPISERLIGLGLQVYPLQPLGFKLPRIPGQLLLDVLADARSNLRLEFVYHFRFDSERGWYVTRPQQQQLETWVGYYTNDPTSVALELHSHNTMPAFFSPTDDGDEQGGRFYAVIGHLDRPNPQLVLRLGMYGHWLTHIPALTLFDRINPLVDIYPDTTAYQAFDNEMQPNDAGWFSQLFHWRSR